MKRNVPLQDRYPNQDGIYTDLRKLTGADLEAQVRYYLQRSEHHHVHAQALIAYRDRLLAKSRHDR